MSADKTLIAYASKGGATEEAAQTIADVLREKFGLEVDLANLRKSSPDIAPYKNVVVGAGVRAASIYGEALKFLKKDFGSRKIAFFVSCGAAGDPEKDPKNYEKACAKYLTDELTKYPNIKPVAKDAFGGRMKVFGKTIWDNQDKAKIRAWAETLGKKFTE